MTGTRLPKERIIIPDRVAERAATRFFVAENGCHISTYSVASHGYAQIGWQDGDYRQMVVAHRAAWVHVNGQIPEGMTIDHLCRTRPCVNPAHLRLLSNFDNARRNHPDHAWSLYEGRCIRGHHRDWYRRRGPERTKGYCHACRMEVQARKRGTVLRNDYLTPAA